MTKPTQPPMQFIPVGDQFNEPGIGAADKRKRLNPDFVETQPDDASASLYGTPSRSTKSLADGLVGAICGALLTWFLLSLWGTL